MAAAVLTIDFNARLASLEAAVRQTNSQLGLIGQTAQKTTGLATTAFRAMGVALVAALGPVAVAASIKHTIDALDELNDRSRKTQTSAEALSVLGFAAKQSGIDAETLDKGLTKLNQSVFNAETGNKRSAAAFKTLGVSLQDLRTDDAATLLAKLDKGFDKLQDGPVKAGLAIELFGAKSGAKILQFNGELGSLTEEAKKFGLEISTKTAQQADEFNDRLGRLSAASQGFKNQITANILPTLNAFAGAFLDDAKQTDGLRSKIVALTADNSLFGYLSSALTLLGNLADAIPKVANLFVALGGRIREIALSFEEFSQKASIISNTQGQVGTEGAIMSSEALAEQTKQLGAVGKNFAAERQKIIDETTAAMTKEGVYSEKVAAIIAKARKLIDEPLSPKKKKRSADDALDTFNKAANAKTDPFEAFTQGLSKESEKLNFDVTNFDRFKGSADSSKRALVEFELEFGKFSTATRAAAGLPALTQAQKDYALSIADAIVKQAEQLKQIKALSAFDDEIKRIQLDTQYLDADNVSRETAIRLFELEKAGVDKTSQAYADRAASLRAALTAQRQANEDRGVRGFDFQGGQSQADAQFQISLIGKSKAAIADLTATRQIDLEVQRRAFDETGKQVVSDETLKRLQEVAEQQKQVVVATNAQLRALQNDALTGAKDFFHDYVDSANDMATQVKGALSNAFSNLEDEFVSFVQTGKFNFKGLVDSINSDLLRIGFKQVAKFGLEQVGGAIGGDFGKSVAGAASGIGGAAGGLSTAASSAALATLTTSVAGADGAMLALSTTGLPALTEAAYAAALALQSVRSTGGASSAGDAASFVGDFFESAKGNVFSMGNIVPFAKGGVFDGPRLAPMALFGEKGPEAIVPLKRNSRGELGLTSASSPEQHVTNNYVNVAAPVNRDLRSAGQHGRMIARQLQQV